jgi:hypothetical protein
MDTMDNKKIFPQSGLNSSYEKDIEPNEDILVDEKKSSDNKNDVQDKEKEAFCCNKCQECRKKPIK